MTCCVFQDCLSPLSMQALPAPPESLCIIEMGGSEAKEETGEAGTVGGLYLNIGLQVQSCINKNCLTDSYCHFFNRRVKNTQFFSCDYSLSVTSYDHMMCL